MEGDPEKLQPKAYNQCPICKRPLYNGKMGVPGKEKKSRFGEYGWVIALVIVVIVIVSILGAFIIANLPNIQPPFDGSETYSSDVIIADGGYFSYDVGWAFSDGIEILFNISSKNNERFDVYIMDENEYYNAYQSDDSMLAFSAYHAVENVSQIIDTINLPPEGYFHLIIDNKDTPLTPDDATPTGIITVEVYLEIENPFNFD